MKLIQTNDYLLLIDEESEIKLNDFYFSCPNGNNYNIIKNEANYFDEKTSSKVIAYYPLTKEAKELDLPLLPNPFEETDIEMLAKDRATILFPKGELCANWRGCVEDFLTGYKAAQSKGQYSLEDMKKAHFHGWFQRENYETKNKETYPLPTNWSNMDYEEKEDWYFNQFIQSLSTQ
jgi:hypothetical protein